MNCPLCIIADPAARSRAQFRCGSLDGSSNLSGAAFSGVTGESWARCGKDARRKTAVGTAEPEGIAGGRCPRRRRLQNPVRIVMFFAVDSENT